MAQNVRKSLTAACVVVVCTLIAAPLLAQVPGNKPAVMLGPGTSVNLTNPPDPQDNPTPLVTQEAFQVYESSCSINFQEKKSGDCRFTAVPDGKQLVVQEFDGRGSLEAGNRLLLIAFSGKHAGLDAISHFFTYTFMGSDGTFDSFATHQETRLYVASGIVPVCRASLIRGSVLGSYRCVVSGFLVEMPSVQQGIPVQPE